MQNLSGSACSGQRKVQKMSSAPLKRTERLIQRSAMRAMPPERMTVSEWAEKCRRLSSESSAEPGPWRNTRTPYLVEVMDAFNDPNVREIVLVAASQVGKALALDTPMPTPTGWTTMGEINVGDALYDEQGRVCHVVGKTEVMHDRTCYRLTFSDGSEITADADHRWMVEIDQNHKPPARKVLTTREMARDYKQGKRNKYAIPVAKALDCSESNGLLIPPYTLGYWLGDGNTYSSNITVGIDDLEIVDYIREEGNRCTVKTTQNPRVFTVAVNPSVNSSNSDICIRGHDMREIGRTKKGRCAECARQYSKHAQYGFTMDLLKDDLRSGHSKLRELGLIGNKHIPKQYLRADYGTRLSLLQGILDSDGHITKNGRCEITLVSKRLVDDVSELLLTLGIKNSIRYKKSICSNARGGPKSSTTWRISFLSYDIPIFRLKRKAARIIQADSVGPHGQKRRTGETLRRRITEIRLVDTVPVRCISVDSPSHLYLAGRAMIPTHNTECELNIFGYIVANDPGSILWIHPTTIDAKEFSKLRIAPMVRDSPVLASLIADPKSRDSGNTVLQKNYPGGILTLTGSTEAHALASKPIRYVIGDEIDRWAGSAGTEGDPWKLAMARQTTFYNAKAIRVSTPTIKGASKIAEAFDTGTMERWKSKCPHCNEFHEIKWDDIRYQSEEVKTGGKLAHLVSDVYYVCPGCGAISTELEMKRQPAKWEPDNPTALRKGVRSFWLNAFVSKWASWEKIIQDFLDARGDTQKLQVVYNTEFGQLWEDRGGLVDEDEMLSRREEYPAELPDGVLLLTMGVDTQDDRLEFEVVGHGHFGETWGIKKGIIMGRPDSQAVWDELDTWIDHRWTFEDGIEMKISMTFVDEGGHFTQEVRSQCLARMKKRVFAIKGRGGQDVPYTSPPSKMKIVLNQKHVGNCWQYSIGVNAGKQKIMDNLRVLTPGRQYCHFPKRDDYGPAFFAGLLSEHLVYVNGLANPWQWKKIPGHERNEALDCRNYALAARYALAPDFDALDLRLKQARGEVTQTVQAKPVAQRSTSSKRVSSGVQKYYDTW